MFVALVWREMHRWPQAPLLTTSAASTKNDTWTRTFTQCNDFLTGTVYRLPSQQQKTKDMSVPRQRTVSLTTVSGRVVELPERNFDVTVSDIEGIADAVIARLDAAADASAAASASPDVTCRTCDAIVGPIVAGDIDADALNVMDVLQHVAVDEAVRDAALAAHVVGRRGK